MVTNGGFGTILAPFAVPAAAIRLLLPALAAQLREWVVIAGAMATTAAVFAIYPFMHSAVTMGLCSVLLGFTLGTVQPMIMSTLHQITPEHRHGQAVALRIMAINASSITMPNAVRHRRHHDRHLRPVLGVRCVVGGGVKLAFKLRVQCR
ncbi:MFS transporter [Bradyrhizobium sp. LMTR 3]|uniref:MFS transporter n=1 Tax=Bradyrhizobium sp. LMTR 3 TaxID=189873 RepID=UPI001AECC3ED|nr:MFS transporter [Bradyrhizobium sp. LMTR 3]